MTLKVEEVQRILESTNQICRIFRKFPEKRMRKLCDVMLTEVYTRPREFLNDYW